MKLPNEVYDILKWITMIVLPALAAAYTGLASVWGWPYAGEIAKTVTVICTLLGALLGISTAEYNREPLTEEEEDEVIEAIADAVAIRMGHGPEATRYGDEWLAKE